MHTGRNGLYYYLRPQVTIYRRNQIQTSKRLTDMEKKRPSSIWVDMGMTFFLGAAVRSTQLVKCCVPSVGASTRSAGCRTASCTLLYMILNVMCVCSCLNVSGFKRSSGVAVPIHSSFCTTFIISKKRGVGEETDFQTKARFCRWQRNPVTGDSPLHYPGSSYSSGVSPYSSA